MKPLISTFATSLLLTGLKVVEYSACQAVLREALVVDEEAVKRIKK